MTGIYKIENTLNGKCYVGKSVRVEKRLERHLKVLEDRAHDNLNLQRAYIKYGSENFLCSVIEECTKDDLNKREVYWISFYRSEGLCYNETNGGDGGDTFSFKSEEEKKRIVELRRKKKKGRRQITNGTEEKLVTDDEFTEIYEPQGWRRGLSDSHKQSLKENHKGFTGRKKSPEHNEKMRQRFIGIPLSEEHKEKLSEAHKGYVLSEDRKKKLVDSWRGRHHSEEAKDKIRESKTGSTQTEESKRKISEKNKGRKLSEATKQKMREKVITEETRRKISKAGIGRVFREETKRKISQALTGRKVNVTWTIGDETKKKHSEAAKGRIHVNNGVVDKMIWPEELEKYAEQGFTKGLLTKPWERKKD